MTDTGYVCSSKHPDKDATCSRRANHDGDHSAYIFSIITPETWPTVPDTDLDA